MKINLKKIGQLVNEANSESDRLGKEYAAELERRETDRLQKFRADRVKQVEEIHATLQERLEGWSRGGRRSATLINIRSEELRFKPRKYFFEDGLKPDCLPDYLRTLFNVCESNGLKPRLYEDTEAILLALDSKDQWKYYGYHIKVRW